MPEATIRSILDAVPLPAIFVGKDDRIAGLNRQAEALLGPVEARPFITAIRQPAVLDAVESCRTLRKPGSARYLAKQGDQPAKAACAWANVMTSAYLAFRSNRLDSWGWGCRSPQASDITTGIKPC